MSTRKSTSNGAKAKPKAKASNKALLARAKSRAETRDSRNTVVLQHAPARTLSYNVAAQSARACEQAYALASLDPIDYNGEFPCAIGYETQNTVKVRARGRVIAAVGTAGTGFFACNPYMSAANNIPDLHYSSATFAGGYPDLGALGVTSVSSSGALFAYGALGSIDTNSVKVAARVVCMGFRVTPVGPITTIGGVVYTHQMPFNDPNDFVGVGSTLGPVMVNDFAKPVVLLNGSQERLTYFWKPPSLVAGDWVPGAVYSGSFGATDWVMIQGAPPGSTFMVEYSCFLEYNTDSLSSISRPTHMNTAVAAEVRTYLATRPITVTPQGEKGFFDAIKEELPSGAAVARAVGPLVRNLLSSAASLLL